MVKSPRQVILTETNKDVTFVEALFPTIKDKIEIKMSYTALVNFVFESPNNTIIASKGDKLMLTKDEASSIEHLLKEE